MPRSVLCSGKSWIMELISDLRGLNVTILHGSTPLASSQTLSAAEYRSRHLGSVRTFLPGRKGYCVLRRVSRMRLKLLGMYLHWPAFE